MIFGKNRKRKFQKNRLHESLEPVKNPGRGWYRIYTYDLAEELPEFYIACEEETIALLLLDIGNFKNRQIPEDALAYLERILDFFRKNKKKMILRPVYDTKGCGLAREPGKVELVKAHMHQLGAVLERYAEDILVVQGLLVGDWGEMHGSKFLSDMHLRELAKEYITAMHHRCYLAVRTPKQWRTIAASLDDEMRKCLVLFNDGIFGSDTDLGTYESSEKRRLGLEWQQKCLGYGPIGGEVVADAQKQQLTETTLDDLRKMHVTYLNSMHDQKLLEQWKMQTMNWNGSIIHVYDYIGMHLGYRFVIRDVVWSSCPEKNSGGGLHKLRMWKKGKFLEVTVENSGFANLYEDTECVIRVEKETSEERTKEVYEIVCVSCDARTWKSGTISKIEISEEMLESYIETERNGWMNIKIYLQLRRKRDGMNIQFANTDADHGVLLGTFR